MILGFGPAQPGVLLEEVDKRDDREDLTIFGGLLLQLYPIFAKSRVHLLSGFFGPAERALRDAGHDVAFLPGDFRRFKLFAERIAARVVAITAPVRSQYSSALESLRFSPSPSSPIRR